MPVADDVRDGRTYGRDRIYRTPADSAGGPKIEDQEFLTTCGDWNGNISRLTEAFKGACHGWLIFMKEL